MKTFKEYAIDYIVDCLNGYEGQEVEVSELSSEITMGDNVNGSITFCRESAKDILNEYYWEVSEFLENYEKSYGEPCRHNYFENAEALHVVLMIETTREYLSKCPTIDDKWDKRIKLTRKIINKLEKELNDEN